MGTDFDGCFSGGAILVRSAEQIHERQVNLEALSTCGPAVGSMIRKRIPQRCQIIRSRWLGRKEEGLGRLAYPFDLLVGMVDDYPAAPASRQQPAPARLASAPAMLTSPSIDD